MVLGVSLSMAMGGCMVDCLCPLASGSSLGHKKGKQIKTVAFLSGPTN